MKVILVNTVKTIFFTFYSFLLLGCNQAAEVENHLIVFQPMTRNAGKIKEDSVFKGHYFCHLDSTSKYGFEYVYHLSEADQEKKLKLVISGKIRTNFVHTTGLVTYVLFNGDKMCNWDASNLRYHIPDLNKWCRFREEVNLLRSTSSFPYTKIFINGLIGDNKKEYFDFDSIRIQLFRSNP